MILPSVRDELVLRQAQDGRINADHGELVEPQAQGERKKMSIQLEGRGAGMRHIGGMILYPRISPKRLSTKWMNAADSTSVYDEN